MTKFSFLWIFLSRAVWVGMLGLGLVFPAHTQPLKTKTPPVAPQPKLKPSEALAKSLPADFIVAVVNSEPITNNEVQARWAKIVQQQPDKTALPPRSELMRDILERMINDRAQLQLAVSWGLQIQEEAIDQAVTNVALQNQISVDELQRRLAVEGVSYPQYRAALREELLLTRLREREIESRVKVSEQEIDTFLLEAGSRESNSRPEINLAQILIRVPERANPETVRQLQTKAQSALQRLREGTAFSAVAAEFVAPKDQAAAAQMGLRPVDKYPALFADATKDLAVNELAGPLRSAAGFHILKVVEKNTGGSAITSVTQSRARHILLHTNAQRSEKSAKEKLAEFKRRINAGKADFATLAKESGEDGSAKEGGDLGWASPGMFVPEFEQVLDALAPNQISEPLVSRFGVHLIQLLERRQVRLTQRQQREAVRSILREQKLEEAYLAWAQETRGRAYVEYREPPQ